MKKLLIILFVLIAVNVQAATYYVAKTGNDSTGDGSEGNPWLTIGKAMSTMVAGDTTYVKAGEYEEHVTTTNAGSAGTPITIAAYSTDNVIVKGDDYSNHVFYITDNYITINGIHIKSPYMSGVVANAGVEGLTVTNCEIEALISSPAHGILSQSDVTNGAAHTGTFTGNKIHGFGTTSSHHGIYWGGSNTTIQNNEIFNNAGYGIQAYCSGDPPCYGFGQPTNMTIDGNILHDNGTASSGGRGGMIVSATNSKITNNVVYNNVRGIVAYAIPNTAYNTEFYNNTVADSTEYNISLADGSGTYYVYDTIFKNNISVNPGTYHITEANASTGTHSFDYNIYYPDSATKFNWDRTNTGNFASYAAGTGWDSNGSVNNPTFLNSTNDNYHQGALSVTVNAGTNLSTTFTNDADGVITRPVVSFDIGAYEYQSSDVTAPTDPSALAGTFESLTTLRLTWTGSTDATKVAGYYVYRDGVIIGIAYNTGNLLSYVDTATFLTTSYSYKVAAFDPAGNISGFSSEIPKTLASGLGCFSFTPGSGGAFILQ